MGIFRRGNSKNTVEEGAIPEFTITMLGGSGSGKTVYMHAFSELFRHGYVGLHKIEGVGETFEEKVAEDEKLRSMSWTQILEDNTGKLVMPEGTVERMDWQFELTHENQPVCKFNWVDYRGGAIEEFKYGSDEANHLMALLARSDGIIMFIDAIPLFYYEDQVARRRWAGANILNGIINSYATFQNSPQYLKFVVGEPKERHLAISIVVSKCDSDLIDDKVRLSDSGHRNPVPRKPYAGIVNRVLEDCKSMLQALTHNSSVELSTGLKINWYPAVVPVGAFGEGYIKTTVEGEEGEHIYKPSGYETHRGNARGIYFKPFNPPTINPEFTPPSPSEVYPRPSNVASPLLWVLDKLLQSERRRGLFKKQSNLQRFANWVSNTSSGKADIRIEAEQQANNPSTRPVVESAAIFPVKDLMK